MQQQQSELNKTVSSVPLIVFLNGLTGLKPKVKMKQQIRHHEGGGAIVLFAQIKLLTET
jgi:hypothetical protein